MLVADCGSSILTVRVDGAPARAQSSHPYRHSERERPVANQLGVRIAPRP
ncbi:hypothetical protein [Xanthomonas arboricola]|jgi:hypothetical protein